jgi:hypothetical protein
METEDSLPCLQDPSKQLRRITKIIHIKLESGKPNRIFKEADIKAAESHRYWLQPGQPMFYFPQVTMSNPVLKPKVSSVKWVPQLFFWR